MKPGTFWAAAAMALITIAFQPSRSRAESATEISQHAKAALERLYSTSPTTRTVGDQAKAILVFPRVLKGGFVASGTRARAGTGALTINGKTVGYYHAVASSQGFQLDFSRFSAAIFFMNEAALAQLNQSGGWVVASAPSLMVVNPGLEKSLSPTAPRKEIYVFLFSENGLLGGVGLKRTKITRYTPSA